MNGYWGHKWIAPLRRNNFIIFRTKVLEMFMTDLAYLVKTKQGQKGNGTFFSVFRQSE